MHILARISWAKEMQLRAESGFSPFSLLLSMSRKLTNCILMTAGDDCVLMTADDDCILMTADDDYILMTADDDCILMTADDDCILMTANRNTK
jgi:hypothetical protein